MEKRTDEEIDFEIFWYALNHENLTEAEYLSRILGPKHLPSKLVIPLTLAYVIIFISGVVGNVATCIVIIKNSNMHTSTNYYLFSLAISDLILLTLGLPNELYSIWQQYPWVLGVVLCKIRAYVSEMSSYVSVLTIVAFSLERYLAICHPLRTHTMGGAQRPIIIILGAWSIAIISALPFAFYTKVNYVEYPPNSGNNSIESAICAMLSPDMPNFPLYEASSIVFFLIPMLIILGVYTRMGMEIKNSARESLNPMNRSSAHWKSRRIQSRKSIIRMLSAVVVMFFFCWAPFHAQRLLYVYGQEADYYPDLNEWLYILSGVLYYFSTSVNPILYNLMSLRYRDAFKETICCKKTRKNQRFVRVERSCRREVERVSNRHNFIHAVRNTIDHAKEIFKFGSTRYEHGREIRSSIDLSGAASITDGNCPERSLLRCHHHSTLDQQPSNQSDVSKNKIGQSLSTASSSV